MNWILGTLTESSMCVGPQGPIVAYPKIVEPCRELGYKLGPRFGELCSCRCLPDLPGLGCNFHATWGLLFSRSLRRHRWQLSQNTHARLMWNLSSAGSCMFAARPLSLGRARSRGGFLSSGAPCVITRSNYSHNLLGASSQTLLKVHTGWPMCGRRKLFVDFRLEDAF